MDLGGFYARFYWGVLSEFKLSATEALLITLVEFLSRKYGVCFASKATIANILNVSDATIYNSIRSLISRGLLRKVNIENMEVVGLCVSELWEEFILGCSEEIEESKGR